MAVIECNLTVMGSASVGKSALINRFVNDTFINDYDPTIAKTFRYRMTLNNTVYSLIINDTAGLEQQSQILTKYIDESLGFILVYSIADKRSFETVQAIYDKLIDEMNGRNVPIILIGNKTDLDGQRSVKHSEGQQLADAWKLNFLEVSAKNGTKVNDIFTTLISSIYPSASTQQQSSQSKQQQAQSNNNSSNSNGKTIKAATTNNNKSDQKCIIS